MTETQTPIPRRGCLSKILLVAIGVVLGFLAAVIPQSLMRARMSANEAFAVGVVRTIVEAEKAYAAQAGSFTVPSCLAAPAREGCFIDSPDGAAAFLDANDAEDERAGYRRVFKGGPAMPTARNPKGLASFCIALVPSKPGSTGARSFAMDQTGKLCQDPAGSNLCACGSLPADCEVLQ